MVFDSVYEMFDPLTTVRKQRFWDWFSGDDLHSRWNQRNITGTGTFAMVNSADEGFSITCASVSSANSGIDFNNKRQFAHNGSECIAVVKHIASSGRHVYQVGLERDAPTQSQGLSLLRYDSNDSNYKHYTMNSSSSTTFTDTGFAHTTDWFNTKITLSSSNSELYVNGVLKTTVTSTLPSNNLQPSFITASASGNSVTHESRIKYMECYNT